MKLKDLDLQTLRTQVVGVDSVFTTPFGQRPLVYCDYTASGRSLRFVESYLMSLQRHYANTHTEDDVTGRSMTQLLHEAEASIKDAVNAGPQGRIIACGTGATAAIDKLQQILGVMLPPATNARLAAMTRACLGEEAFTALSKHLQDHRPVVFVGPYEHHSNEVTWREGMATVVEVNLDAEGCVDLEHLEALLQDARYQDRPRIGSFSAASNVTGMISPVHDIARLLHRYDAIACFDFAASGPYVKIDMSPALDADGGDPTLDAVFLSPHKFLGGPGSSGVLVFNDRVYPHELSPTVGGGGTVDYVGYDSHEFLTDVEEREKAGTPGVLQILKAALAMQVKSSVGEERIEAVEHDMVVRAFVRWKQNPHIEILGNADPKRRVAIVSFNLKDPQGQYLHPKYITRLANDLFGIQSRAGCSCAGPYGHRLLDIDHKTSERYRAWIVKGFRGLKPGWCRVGFHYVMDDADVEYIIEAVDFLANHAHAFMPLYDFDLATGIWSHKKDVDSCSHFSLQAALDASAPGCTAIDEAERRGVYGHYLNDANEILRKLQDSQVPELHRLEGEAGELQYFVLPTVCGRPHA